MTNHTAYPVQDGATAGATNIAHKGAEIALMVAVAVALAAAWLALFMFPLDISTLGPH